MATPRVFSKYCAARAQSLGRISANEDVDVAIARKTTRRKITRHLYSALTNTQPATAPGSGSARVSRAGESVALSRTFLRISIPVPGTGQRKDCFGATLKLRAGLALHARRARYPKSAAAR